MEKLPILLFLFILISCRGTDNFLLYNQLDVESEIIDSTYDNFTIRITNKSNQTLYLVKDYDLSINFKKNNIESQKVKLKALYPSVEFKSEKEKIKFFINAKNCNSIKNVVDYYAVDRYNSLDLKININEMEFCGLETNKEYKVELVLSVANEYTKNVCPYFWSGRLVSNGILNTTTKVFDCSNRLEN